MYMFAKKFGFADKMFKNIKVENGAVSAEDILREINRGGWSTGYCGQSPERLKAHMKNQAKFDLVTLRAPKDDRRNRRRLLRPAVAVLGNAGIQASRNADCSTTPISAVKDGGGTFRARFGVERVVKRKVMQNGQEVEKEEHDNLLAEGSYSLDSEIKDGYPEFTLGVLKKLGWDKDLTAAEMAIIERVNAANPDAVSWSIDLSGGIQRVAIEHGCSPYGNGKARMIASDLPDPIPVHREVDLHVAARSGRESIRRCPDARAVPRAQHRLHRAEGGRRQGHRQAVPAHPEFGPAGRIRRRRRGNPLQQVARRTEAGHVRRDQSGGCQPRAVSRTAAGSGSPAPRAVRRTRMKALVTERVGKGVAWMPYHFAGWYEGADLRGKYPKGADPIVLGESVNTLTTYGYDPATGMQEPKAHALSDPRRREEKRPWLA